MSGSSDSYKVLKPIHAKSGWTILPVSYRHDPEKADPDWIRDQKASYPSVEQWNREMEMDFTAQLGAAAYGSFNFGVNVVDKIRVVETLPICIACDFNVDHFVFELCQIRAGRLFVFDEICLSPGTVDKMIEEFRNRYPAHFAGISIYGDANGHRRTAQTQRSDYDLMLLSFAGYPGPVELKVARQHPNPKDRINSTNRKIKGAEGRPGVFIAKHCVELIKDFQEVVWNSSGKDVLKIYDASKSYSARTHASDALSYLIFREWPTRSEVLKLTQKKARPRKPLTYTRLIGDMEE